MLGRPEHDHTSEKKAMPVGPLSPVQGGGCGGAAGGADPGTGGE
jgi:hypothetical protein